MVARIVESPAELPLPLPPGLTVVPAQDPDRFARALAARTGAVLVASAEEAESVLARRRAHHDPSVQVDAAEAGWLRSVLEGGPTQVPARLMLDAERAPYLQDLGRRLADAREYLKHARVALLKREAAVQAEVRKAPGAAALAGVEPELAQRVSHRVSVTLRRARAAKRALGAKPTLDRETEAAARRAMSRLEDAQFAYAKARARVHSRLAVGNVVGLVLALLAAIMLWTGADLDAASLYSVFALSGLSPIVALAIGGVGAVHSRRRVAGAQAECRQALRQAGVRDTEELSRRRSELEEWLARADATAAARDAWHEALQAWQAMAGTEADPRDVEELLAAGTRLREVKAEAADARGRAEAALQVVATIEAEVETRLEQVLAGRPLSSLLVDGGGDDRPIVLAGSGGDQARIEELRPPVPVALVTGVDGRVLDLREDADAGDTGGHPEAEADVVVAAAAPAVAPEPQPVVEPVPEPLTAAAPAPEPELVGDDEVGGRLLVLNPEAARRLRRRARRLR